MEMTTIQISKDLKSKIDEFSIAKESYDITLGRIVELAEKKFIENLFFNDNDLSLEESLKFVDSLK